jgi:hypothetical protein
MPASRARPCCRIPHLVVVRPRVVARHDARPLLACGGGGGGAGGGARWGRGGAVGCRGGAPAVRSCCPPARRAARGSPLRASALARRTRCHASRESGETSLNRSLSRTDWRQGGQEGTGGAGAQRGKTHKPWELPGAGRGARAGQGRAGQGRAGQGQGGAGLGWAGLGRARAGAREGDLVPRPRACTPGGPRPDCAPAARRPHVGGLQHDEALGGVGHDVKVVEGGEHAGVGGEGGGRAADVVKLVHSDHKTGVKERQWGRSGWREARGRRLHTRGASTRAAGRPCSRRLPPGPPT